MAKSVKSKSEIVKKPKSAKKVVEEEVQEENKAVDDFVRDDTILGKPVEEAPVEETLDESSEKTQDLSADVDMAETVTVEKVEKKKKEPRKSKKALKAGEEPKVKRAPSAYNLFVKEFAGGFKGDRKEMLKEAGLAWKQSKAQA